MFDVASGSQMQTQQGAAANTTTTVSVTKNGAGTAVMNGTNSYSGATTVAAGTMEVTGSLANAAVTVNSGAACAGTGFDQVSILGSGALGFGGTLDSPSFFSPNRIRS